MIRYAIYYAPAVEDPLWQFGSSVIGYDAASGVRVPFPAFTALPENDLAAWTAEPRQYGFHATLKAPFTLAAGCEAADLMERAGEFAAAQSPFRIAPLQLEAIGPFLALVLSDPAPEVAALAAECVRRFDRFRAPLTPEDRERRLRTGLSARQRAQLDSWGYPYVFGDFRFHMTLSGPLNETDRLTFAQALAGLYAPIREACDSHTIDAIAVFRQDGAGSPFVIQKRFPFPC